MRHNYKDKYFREPVSTKTLKDWSYIADDIQKILNKKEKKKDGKECGDDDKPAQEEDEEG